MNNMQQENLSSKPANPLNSTNSANNADNRTKDQIRDKTSEIRNNIRETASEVGDSARDVGQNVRDLSRLFAEVLYDTLDNVRKSATDYYQRGVGKAQGMEKSFETRVQHRPLLSVMIAAVAGLLIGFTVRRNS